MTAPTLGGTVVPMPMTDEIATLPTLAAQAESLRAGEVSAQELLDVCLERIQRLDPRLNAVRTVRADAARAEAAAAQKRLDAGESAPLLGVPIAVKDNVDIAGETTCHGTGAITRTAPGDSDVVRRLRAAGAIMVGKTHLPELAMWGNFTESETYGVTRNPWDLDHSTGGSSGGTAAAVAAGIVGGGLGSDGGASIRVPAGLCGVYGLKPQRGRVPLAPDDDHWHGLTVFGPIARTTRDAALLLDAMTDAGGFSAATETEPRPLRIAVSFRNTLPGIKLDAQRRAAVEQTAQLLTELGHEVVARNPRYGQLLPEIMPHYLNGVALDAAKLDEPAKLEPRSAKMARYGRLLGGRPLRRALRRRDAIAARINAIFDDSDVVLTPLVSQPPEPIGKWAGKGPVRTFNGSGPYVGYTGVWNYAGNPAASIPAGLDAAGLPVAVQAVGAPGNEATLLALSAQLEAARPWAQRRPPVS
jgi:amidase